MPLHDGESCYWRVKERSCVLSPVSQSLLERPPEDAGQTADGPQPGSQLCESGVSTVGTSRMFPGDASAGPPFLCCEASSFIYLFLLTPLPHTSSVLLPSHDNTYPPVHLSAAFHSCSFSFQNCLILQVFKFCKGCLLSSPTPLFSTWGGFLFPQSSGMPFSVHPPVSNLTPLTLLAK